MPRARARRASGARRTPLDARALPRCGARQYVVKVCLFQFVNSYIALFYVAFVKAFGMTISLREAGRTIAALVGGHVEHGAQRNATAASAARAGEASIVGIERWSAEYCHDLSNFEQDDSQIRRRFDGVNPCVDARTKPPRLRAQPRPARRALAD